MKLGLNYEIKRQAEVLDKGGTIRQETRLWNENRDQTESMRSKESAHDYRYFPEPDLPPFIPDAAFQAKVDASMVELPAAREKRLIAEFALAEHAAALICEEKPLADYFEAAVHEALVLGLSPHAAAERVSAWLSSDVKRVMNRDGIDVADIGSMKLTPGRLASLVHLVVNGKISGKIAKQTLETVFAEDADPDAIVKARDWEQITDPAAIGKAVSEAFAADLKAVAAAAAGDEKIKAYLVGKTIAATGGRADPVLAGRLVTERLTSKSE